MQQSISVSATSLTFPNTRLEAQSLPQPVTLTNTGYGDVAISKIIVVGDFVDLSPDFEVIKPGESVQLWVAFQPHQLGQLSGGLYIDTGNAAGQEFISLSGSSVPNGAVLPVEETEAFIYQVGDPRWMTRTEALEIVTDIADQGLTAAGALRAANNLNDVANKSQARTNLGLEIGKDVAANSIVAWTGKTSRTNTERARDLPHLFDFIPAAQHAAIETHTSTYDASGDLRAASQALNGGTLWMPRGTVGIANTVVLNPGTTMQGHGNYDPRAETGIIGSMIKALGAGNPQRWTDIDGLDAADDTPMLVAGGNGVFLRDLVLHPGDTPWSIGFHVPAVARCGYDRLVTAIGFTDAGVYLDMTWSDRNTTLKALHPEIIPAAGCVEFEGNNGYLRGTRPLRIQGTTRDPSTADVNTWQWGWGGVSDSVFSKNQFRPGGANVGAGACIWLDGALPGVSALAMSGISFIRNALRAGNAPKMVHFGRVSRVEFFDGYGESGSSSTTASWWLHPTQTTEITVHGGRYLRAPIFIDGVDTGKTMENGQGGHASFYNRTHDGNEYRPGYTLAPTGIFPADDNLRHLGTASRNWASVRTKLVRADVGDLTVRGDTGVELTTGSTSVRRLYAQDSSGAVLPGADNAQAFGSATLRWQIGYFESLRFNGSSGPRIIYGAGSPEGVASAPPGSLYLNSNGNGSWRKSSGSGNTGWIAGA